MIKSKWCGKWLLRASFILVELTKLLFYYIVLYVYEIVFFVYVHRVNRSILSMPSFSVQYK